MLAVVFGAEQIRIYVYGRSFTIESDHKLLESITQKSLADTPAWLKYMLLCLQTYDYSLHYCPGKEMVLPDTLLQFKCKSCPEIALDIAIHHACLSPVQKGTIQLALETDVEMHALADIIISGWPDNIKEVPHPVCLCWQHHELLTVEYGLVFCGETFIISPSEREKVLGTLPQSHQGITKTQLLGHSCIFWPGLKKAIYALQQCETCMRFQAQNAAAPLRPMHTPSHPWQICPSDIFTLDGVDFLIFAVFYSKAILVHNIPAGQSYSAKVIHILKEWFCDHGMLEVLCTDNGLQYASAAFADCSIE